MKNSIDEQALIVADTQQISSHLPDGDLVILSLKDGMYFGLNKVGARIWGLVQNPVTVREILDVLLEEYEVDRRQCLDEVNRLLGELAENGLITVQLAQRVP